MYIPFLLSLLTILISYTLKKIGVFNIENTTVLSKIIMNLTFPALILLTISKAEMTQDLLILPMLPVISGFVGLGLGILFFRNHPPETKGLILMGTIGLNIGLFAFPIIEAVFGTKGLQVAALIDLGNAFMIFGVSYVVGSHYSPVQSNKKRGFLKTAAVFFRSVPFMTYIIGLSINISDLTLPDFLQQWLHIAGRANQFLVLLVLGLVLSFDWRKYLKQGVIPLFLLRYSLGLLFCIGIWYFLPVEDPLVRKVAAICMILPAGFALIPFSIEFKYDRETSGALVNISIIFSFFIMWILTILL